jgi:hypothetical protein
LETAAKLLELLEPVSIVFSKCALQLLDDQADFDSAIPRFESWRPSRGITLKTLRLFGLKVFVSKVILNAILRDLSRKFSSENG